MPTPNVTQTAVSYSVIDHKGDKILVFSIPVTHVVLTDEQARALAVQLSPTPITLDG